MRWTRRSFIKAGLAITAGIVATDVFWLEKLLIEVNEFFLGNKDRDKGIRVLQLSDLHIKTLSARLKELAAQINQLKPDLILITGDSLDKAGNLSMLNDFLKLLHHDTPKIAVTGNWDYWSKVDLIDFKKILTSNNCDLLVNENKQYVIRNQTVTITGIDDFIAGEPDIEKAIIGITKSDYHIVLNHCPEYSTTILEKLKDKIPYNLILSGHTHGGQINFFGLILYKPPGSGKYLKGWYENDTLYVSKGIGTSSFPGRFMCHPEIAIFNIT